MSRYPHLSAQLYQKNRKKLAKKLKNGSIAILGSNKRFNSNADALFPFIQNSDFLYLSGIHTENTLLVISKNDHGDLNEYLLIPKISENKAIWEGDFFNENLARELSGISNVLLLHDLDSILKREMSPSTLIYLPLKEGGVNLPSNASLTGRIKRKYPNNDIVGLLPLIHQQRMIKENEEVGAIREAIRITELGLRQCIPMIMEGTWEFELEAELLKSIIRERSRGFAFEPIIASGTNSCILHYVENHSMLRKGSGLLLDVGAEFGGYNADITRYVPIGKFTDRQNRVFQSVENVLKQALLEFRPGNTIKKVNSVVATLIQDELVSLGLLSERQISGQSKKKPAYSKYYMHSASHFLGIDVHDAGQREAEFKPGMVMTLEPGIYVKEWGFGIRLEEDILITKEGSEVLSKQIPRHWEDW